MQLRVRACNSNRHGEIAQSKCKSCLFFYGATMDRSRAASRVRRNRSVRAAQSHLSHSTTLHQRVTTLRQQVLPSWRYDCQALAVRAHQDTAFESDSRRSSVSRWCRRDRHGYSDLSIISTLYGRYVAVG